MSASVAKPADPGRLSRVRRIVLRWARKNGRTFFWRQPGVSPFALLVTEILLSRTRAQAVEPVATRLLARFPSPGDLARADAIEVERVLRPLGLHRKRATRLIACAQDLVSRFNQEVPHSVDSLLSLPYVGRYAANAVLCFGFGRRRGVIDANVSRLYQRLFSLPVPPARLSSADALWDFAEVMLPRASATAKEFNWAILDLGGTVCTPRAPLCASCPLALECDAHRSGRQRPE